MTRDVRSPRRETSGVRDARRQESETIGSFYVRRTDPPTLWQIDTGEGFHLADLMTDLDCPERQALG